LVIISTGVIEDPKVISYSGSSIVWRNKSQSPSLSCQSLSAKIALANYLILPVLFSNS
jgi:hypothetical protein